MDRDTALAHLLNRWHQDSECEYIDMYDALEDALPTDRGRLHLLVSELDAFVAETSSQQRYEELDRLNDECLPFRPEDVDHLLEDLRSRLVDGIESDTPTPMESRPGMLWPRDVPEGPFPEVLRLARYMEEYVSGERRNPFLSEAASADCMSVTAARIDDLDEIYSERLIKEITRLRTGEVRDWFSAVGDGKIWASEDDADAWVDFVEFLCRYKLQMPGRPDEYEEDALADLRENAAAWPSIEAYWSPCADLLGNWRSADPGTALGAALATKSVDFVRAALSELDLLLAASAEVRERILDIVVLQRPRQPNTDEFLGELREKLVARLGTM